MIPRQQVLHLRTRRGLTMIELLAAAALAAMMCVAVLGVLGSLAARQRLLMEERAPRGWQLQLVELLRDDLVQARSLIWTADSLSLTGFGASDAANGAPLHRRAQIVYSIRQIGATQWLIRTEAAVGDLSGRNDRSELVCAGVTEISIRSAVRDAPEHLPAELTGVLEPEDVLEEQARLPVPARLVIVLYGADRERALFEETIHCR